MTVNVKNKIKEKIKTKGTTQGETRYRDRIYLSLRVFTSSNNTYFL